jgi:hypothetical protein
LSKTPKSRAYTGAKMASQKRDDKYAASKFGGNGIPEDRVKLAMEKYRKKLHDSEHTVKKSD